MFRHPQVQKVVDYDRILESSDAFKGADVGFCALGTTRGKSGVVRLACIASFVLCAWHMQTVFSFVYTFL